MGIQNFPRCSSVVGRQNTFMSCTPLRYVRNVTHEEMNVWGDWKCKYRKRKYQGMEYRSTENRITNLQGWKMQLSKMKVPKCVGGIRKYGKGKYKSAGTENVSTETGRAILTQIWQTNITTKWYRQCFDRSSNIFTARCT